MDSAQALYSYGELGKRQGLPKTTAVGGRQSITIRDKAEGRHVIDEFPVRLRGNSWWSLHKKFSPYE